jgi:hypothetical protein
MSAVKRWSCLCVLAVAGLVLLTARAAVAQTEGPAPAPEQLTADPNDAPAEQIEEAGDEPNASGSPEEQTNWRRWRCRSYGYSYYYRPRYYYYPCYYYRPCVTYTYCVPCTVVSNGQDGANGETAGAQTAAQARTSPTPPPAGSNDLSALRNSLPLDGAN